MAADLHLLKSREATRRRRDDIHRHYSRLPAPAPQQRGSDSFSAEEDFPVTSASESDALLSDNSKQKLTEKQKADRAQAHVKRRANKQARADKANRKIRHHLRKYCGVVLGQSLAPQRARYL